MSHIHNSCPYFYFCLLCSIILKISNCSAKIFSYGIITGLCFYIYRNPTAVTQLEEEAACPCKLRGILHSHNLKWKFTGAFIICLKEWSKLSCLLSWNRSSIWSNRGPWQGLKQSTIIQSILNNDPVRIINATAYTAQTNTNNPDQHVVRWYRYVILRTAIIHSSFPTFFHHPTVSSQRDLDQFNEAPWGDRFSLCKFSMFTNSDTFPKFRWLLWRLTVPYPRYRHGVCFPQSPLSIPKMQIRGRKSPEHVVESTRIFSYSLQELLAR